MVNTKVPHIFAIVGPKHTGKTSIGKLLSQLVQARFIDLDAFIEARSNTSVRELYQQGVAVFRLEEAQALLEVIKSAANTETPLVLATGGGIIDNAEAFDALRSGTFIINLDVETELAWKRIERSSERSGSLPPFLRTNDPKESHRELHESRSIQYHKVADLNFKTAEKTTHQIAEEIFALLPNQSSIHA